MIKCPECGFENEEGVLQCNDCGHLLEETTPQPVQPQAEVQEEEELAVAPEQSAQPEAPERQAETPDVPETPPVHAGTLRLVVTRGKEIGKEYPLYEGEQTIGRPDPDKPGPVDIDLNDQEQDPDKPKVSRRHAVIKIENGVCSIKDVGSTNGTFINRGDQLEQDQWYTLNVGDEITVANIYLRLVEEGG